MRPNLRDVAFAGVFKYLVQQHEVPAWYAGEVGYILACTFPADGLKFLLKVPYEGCLAAGGAYQFYNSR